MPYRKHPKSARLVRATKGAQKPPLRWAGTPPADDEEARRRLLEASMRSFSRKGVMATTIADVAREAGVSRPTVYKHFDGKDDLIRGLLLHAAPAFTGRLATAIVPSRGLERTLEDLVLFCLAELPDDPLFGVLFRDEAAIYSSRLILGSPELIDHTAALLSPLLAQAERRGALREGLDAADLVEWSIRLVLSYLTIPSSRSTPTEALREVIHDLLVPAVIRSAPPAKAEPA